MDMTLGEIAELVGAQLEGDASVHITGLSGIEDAAPGDLTFYADPRYRDYLATTEATALLVSGDFRDDFRPLLRVERPYEAFSRLLRLVEQRTRIHPRGIHSTAVIAPSAVLGRDVAIDAHAVVCEGARVGDRAVLYAGVYVGRDSAIGEDTIVYPNVTVRERVQIGARCIIHSNAAIGTDGFGFTGLGASRVKIPQIGGVLIGDEVEIGSNSAVDRATTGNTVIGRGTKIDNVVQIGHNVVIGEYCAISGNVGIAGSVKIGNGVLIAGQAGIADHVKIGDGAILGAKSGVHKDVAPGSVVWGDQFEAGLGRRIRAALVYLPDLLKRFRKLEKRMDALEK